MQLSALSISAQMSKFTYDSLTQMLSSCTQWQQWASKG